MICLLSPWLIDMWQWGIIELMTPISCLHASKDRPPRPILPIALEKYFIYMNFIFHRSIQEANKTMCFKITKNKNEASNDVVFRCIYWNCFFHKEQCLTKEGSVFCNGLALVPPIFCLTSPWPHLAPAPHGPVIAWAWHHIHGLGTTRIFPSNLTRFCALFKLKLPNLHLSVDWPSKLSTGWNLWYSSTISVIAGAGWVLMWPPRVRYLQIAIFFPRVILYTISHFGSFMVVLGLGFWGLGPWIQLLGLGFSADVVKGLGLSGVDGVGALYTNIEQE